MNKIYIGIDNGTTGSIGVLDGEGKIESFFRTPAFRCANYTKKSKNITRINVPALVRNLSKIVEDNPDAEILVILERPMVNPTRWTSSLSAIRAFEATLIVLDFLELPYKIIDSKAWQKTILGKEVCGKELKTESKRISIEKYPHLEATFNRQKDGDGILIALYALKKRLKAESSAPRPTKAEKRKLKEKELKRKAK